MVWFLRLVDFGGLKWGPRGDSFWGGEGNPGGLEWVALYAPAPMTATMEVEEVKETGAS